MAILGNAAGTTARAYGHFFPQTAIDAVEIDGELTDIGRRYFDLRGPRLRTFTADARPFLRRTKERYDAILVDAYRQPYIPFYLATKEFFALAARPPAPRRRRRSSTSATRSDSPRLEQVLVRDAGAPSSRRSCATRARTSTRSCWRRRAARPARGCSRARRRCPPSCARSRLAAAARLAPGLRGGRVYTDDVAPVEWLIDSSIVQFAAGDG